MDQSDLRESDLLRYSANQGSPALIRRGFFSNSRRADTFPSKRVLAQVSDFFRLTIDGSYRLYDVVLDKLSSLERQLNATRTRLVEPYIFSRDAPLAYPRRLRPTASPARSAFLSEIVEDWQETTVRSFEKWLFPYSDELFLQLGVDDDMASPSIPRGSLVQAVTLDETESRIPLLNDYYIIQHQHGYLCCRCTVGPDSLLLRSHGVYYQGRHYLHLGKQARIMGRAMACLAVFPLPPRGGAVVSSEGSGAPIIAPGSHTYIRNAIRAKRLRFHITNREIDEAAERLASQGGLNYHVTGKHTQRIEEGAVEPHLPTCLMLSPILSLRYSDILAIHHVALNDTGRWSLETRSEFSGMPGAYSGFRQVEAPSPASLWSAFFGHWQNLPMLLYQLRNRLEDRNYTLFYLCQSSRYRGLYPILPDGSLLAVEPLRSPIHNAVQRSGNGWERSIYILRIGDEWIASYIEVDDTAITLLPHPDADGVEPWTISRSKVQMYGVVIGVLFRLSSR